MTDMLSRDLVACPKDATYQIIPEKILHAIKKKLIYVLSCNQCNIAIYNVKSKLLFHFLKESIYAEQLNLTPSML